MSAVNLPEGTLLFPEESRPFLEPYLPPKNGSESPFAWATLTFATSLDSQLALSPGAQTVLSGPQSKAMTHYLRSRHDAIMIGVGTAVADDPSLNCRLHGVGGYGGEGLERQPRPVIIDPKARWDFSDESKILTMVRKGRGRAPYIITSHSTTPPIHKKELLERHGGKYIALPAHASPDGAVQLSWADVLRSLKDEGLRSVMIEGGGGVINSLLEPQSQELISSVVVTIAPTWLGQGGVVVSPRRRFNGGQAIPASRLTSVVWQPFGDLPNLNLNINSNFNFNFNSNFNTNSFNMRSPPSDTVLISKKADVDIAAEGDLIMVVGPEKSRLRVHSLPLKLGSEVLRAMFDSNFSEGSKLRQASSNNPVDIEFPEDNTKAFTLICSILHHRSDLYPKSLTSDECIELAKLAHKYDCQDSIRDTVIARKLIPAGRKVGDQWTTRYILKALVAAYIFSSGVVFGELAERLIWRCTRTSLLALFENNDDLRGFLPARFLEDMDQLWTNTKEDVIFLYARVNSLLSTCVACKDELDYELVQFQDHIRSERKSLDDAHSIITRKVELHEECGSDLLPMRRFWAAFDSITDVRCKSMLQNLKESEGSMQHSKTPTSPPSIPKPTTKVSKKRPRVT